MKLTSFSVVSALFFLIQFSAAEEVQFRDCPAISDMETVARNCTVHNLRISPCPAAANNQPCSLKRRQSAEVSFDFTPEKLPTALNSQAYWASDMDLPFAGMDTNACTYSDCNKPAGQRNTYTHRLRIPNNAQSRTYDVKWKLWNDDMECCFVTTFVVRKKN